MKKGLLIFTMVCGLFFLSFLSVHAETSPGKPNVEKIPGGGITPLPSPSIPSSKTSCFLQYDNGVALTFFPNWNPGDKNSIYFDPETCDIPYPYPYPFQITGVELLLYNHAAVESVVLKFWVQEMEADICE